MCSEGDRKLTGLVEVWHVDFGEAKQSTAKGKRYKVYIELNRTQLTEGKKLQSCSGRVEKHSKRQRGQISSCGRGYVARRLYGATSLSHVQSSLGMKQESSR